MNVLYVNGHPYAKSFHAAIRDAYVDAAKANGHDVKVLNLGELTFDPVLRYGYCQAPHIINTQSKPVRS